MSFPQNKHDDKKVSQFSGAEEQHIDVVNDETPTVEPRELIPEIFSNNNVASGSSQTSHSAFTDLTLIPPSHLEPSKGNDRSSVYLNIPLSPSKENDESSTHPSIAPPPYSPSTEVTRASSDDIKIHIGDEFQPSLGSISQNRTSTVKRHSSPQNYTSSTITTQPLPIQHPSADLQSQRDTSSSSWDPLTRDLAPLKFCKICQEPELLETSRNNENDNVRLLSTENRLISPCKCKGSLQYVHLNCLNEWRATTVRQDASYQCEVCKYEYRFYRPRLAKIVGSHLFLHTMTVIMFLLVIYGTSWIVKVIDLHAINKNPSPPDSTNPNSWMYTNILGVGAIHLIIGISIISFAGACFLIIHSCIKGYKSTRGEYCYCGDCGLQCAGCYWLGGGCNGDECGGFVIVLFIFIMGAVFIIGILGALSAGYLLIQRVSITYLDRIKESILEVKKD